MTTAMTTPAVASVETIRSRFPALDRRHNGTPVAYFDGPGGTQVPQSVVDAMSDYLLHHNANTHWAYPTSVETDALLEAARETLADFLGGRPSEIAFGANMTTLTFHLGRALGRRWSRGDEIVVTELDHHANSDTWRQLAKDRGLTVKAVPFRLETGQLDMERPRLLDRPAHAARRDRRRVERARDDQRRAPRRRAGARGRGARLRRRRPLRPARARGRRGARRRLPRLLGLQVLRTARRRAVGPPVARRRRWICRGSSPRPRLPRRTSRRGHRTTRASSARPPRWTSWPRSPKGRPAAPGWGARSRRSTPAASSSSSVSGPGCGRSTGCRSTARRRASRAPRPSRSP